MSRALDITVFGATGFVGQLVCAYLAERCAEEPTTWAIGGRDRAKLERLRDDLVTRYPTLEPLPIVVADSHDEASLVAMAEGTKVVLTTVGPYAPRGEALLRACADTGTHYVDLTGEPGWWRDMTARYHDRARETGAKIVPACGFDSIPFDLGAYFTARQLPPDAPKQVRGYVAARAGVSGGTLRSALSILADRGGPRESKPRAPDGARPRARGPHRAAEVGAWVIPLPTIDPLIVGRSTRLCDAYGPDFVYHHYLQVGPLPAAVGVLVGIGLLTSLARIGPARRALARMRPPGSGPSAERRARSWFRAKFVGEGGGRRVVTQMRGGDPGYDETAKMVAESALCLAHDRLDPDPGGGLLTSASAMGMALVERLARAGLGLEVLDSGPA
jgi:short subunit dehydrogenase-like uncharacterized protein